MPENQNPVAPGPAVVLVVAAPSEAAAVALALDAVPPSRSWTRTSLDPCIDLVVTGVGKSNAAGACARLLQPGRDALVLNVGLGGSLPGGPSTGSVVVATDSVFADEGVGTPDAFLTCETLGFPAIEADAPPAPEAARWRDAAIALGALPGILATVSTCSGSDRLAREVASRTGAVGEGMEGAAVALVARRLGLPFLEVRAISNTTGDRSKQLWDLRGALRTLGEFTASLLKHTAKSGL